MQNGSQLRRARRVLHAHALSAGCSQLERYVAAFIIEMREAVTRTEAFATLPAPLRLRVLGEA